jgi:hypothetical protein
MDLEDDGSITWDEWRMAAIRVLQPVVYSNHRPSDIILGKGRNSSAKGKWTCKAGSILEQEKAYSGTNYRDIQLRGGSIGGYRTRTGICMAENISQGVHI